MLFVNGQLYTMDGPMIKEGYLYVKEGKIAAVGPMTELDPQLKQKAQISDLGGKQVYPGFIDAHTHLGLCEDGVGDEGEDINEMTDSLTPHLRALDGINPLDPTMKEGWAAGVTTLVVSPGSANPISGQIVALKAKGVSVDKMMIKEPFAMKFALGENPKRVYGEQELSPSSRMGTAALIREQLTKAKHYMEELERVKDSEDSPPDFDFRNEALIPVLKRKIKAHFHAHRAYDILTAIRLGREFNLDVVIIHGTEGYRVADEIAEAGVPVVCGPLMGTRSKPELSAMTLDNPGLLVKAGVQVAICTDHPVVQTELLPACAALVTNHGLTQEQALESITSSAADIVGLGDRVGRLKVGLDADFLVYSHHPLNITAYPDAIYLNGAAIS